MPLCKVGPTAPTKRWIDQLLLYIESYSAQWHTRSKGKRLSCVNPFSGHIIYVTVTVRLSTVTFVRPLLDAQPGSTEVLMRNAIKNGLNPLKVLFEDGTLQR